MEALLVGDFGINGFVTNIIDKLLDTLPLDHSAYTELFDLLGNFSAELARKMRNWRKVGLSLPAPSLTLFMVMN
jgi:hypothetical protein